LDECLGPAQSIDNHLGCVSLVVPEDANALTAEHNHLVTSTSGRVGQPGAKVLLLDKVLDLGSVELLGNSTLSAKAIDVGKLVDSHGVLLVESDPIELLHCCGSFSRSRVFNKGKSTGRSIISPPRKSSQVAYPSVSPLSPRGM
jgi:hypothetical protein